MHTTECEQTITTAWAGPGCLSKGSIHAVLADVQHSDRYGSRVSFARTVVVCWRRRCGHGAAVDAAEQQARTAAGEHGCSVQTGTEKGRRVALAKMVVGPLHMGGLQNAPRSRLTSSRSSRMSLALASSLTTALLTICLARSA